MNRIEIVALFTALDEMYENKNIESMGRVIKAVLREASTEEKKKKSDLKPDDE